MHTIQIITLDSYQTAWEIANDSAESMEVAPLPQYRSDEAAGVDLHASISEQVTLAPNESMIIPTGIRLNIRDSNIAFLVYTKLSNGFNYSVTLSSSVLVIDCDYRGEVLVKVVNNGDKSFTINPFDVIAQGVFTPIIRPVFDRVEKFRETSHQ